MIVNSIWKVLTMHFNPTTMLPTDDIKSNELYAKCASPAVRLADNNDVVGLLELWGNSASLRTLYDSLRWNWKTRASQLWQKYAHEILNQKMKVLIICDKKDNGLSGFLIARIERLPEYFEPYFAIVVEEFYLRPKDRSAEHLSQMITLLMNESRKRLELSPEDNMTLRFEVLASDENTISLLKDYGFRKSTVSYSLKV